MLFRVIHFKLHTVEAVLDALLLRYRPEGADDPTVQGALALVRLRAPPHHVERVHHRLRAKPRERAADEAHLR